MPVAVLLVLRSRTTVMLVAAYDLGLLVLAIVDWLISPRPGHFTLDRQMPRHLSLGTTNKVGWELRNASPYTVAFEVTEDVPEGIERETPIVSGEILAQSRAELRYDVRPTRRGLYEFGDMHLRYRTVLGLITRQRRFRGQTPVKVYPNVASLARYELAAHRHRLNEFGLTAARQRGKGLLLDRKSTRLNSSHIQKSRMPSSA